jgi:hypothetical protein
LVKEQRQCLISDPGGSTPFDWPPGSRPADSKISMVAFTELGDMPNYITCIALPSFADLWMPRRVQMKHASYTHPISWFQNNYKSGRLELRPPFQRKPVWTDKQRCALIESILLNIPVPEVYVQVTQDDDGTEEYGIVDGQQRIRTILQFIGIERPEDREGNEDVNSFALEKLPTTSIYKDKTFADVKETQRKDFYQYAICARFLYTDETREVEDVFKRLNKYTLPLKAQELRNATFHGPFAKLSESLADDQYWAVNGIITAARIRRMGDIEMMSDFLIGLLHGPQGGSAKIIDQYYEEYEPFEDEFPEQTRVEKLFAQTHAKIKLVFPDIANTSRWGNRADFYSLFVATGHLLKDHILPKSNKAKLAKRLNKLAEAVDKELETPTTAASTLAQKYARAIEKGVNDKARRTDRHEVLLELMSPLFREK